jgi:hypothetical protein
LAGQNNNNNNNSNSLNRKEREERKERMFLVRKGNVFSLRSLRSEFTRRGGRLSAVQTATRTERNGKTCQ